MRGSTWRRFLLWPFNDVQGGWVAGGRWCAGVESGGGAPQRGARALREPGSLQSLWASLVPSMMTMTSHLAASMPQVAGRGKHGGRRG